MWDFIDLSLKWNSADLIAIVVSTLLSTLAFYLGGQQSKIISNQMRLQAALAEMEVREKLGCIKVNMEAFKSANGRAEKSRGVDKLRAEAEKSRYMEFMLQDCLAALVMYDSASQKLQEEYSHVLITVIDALEKVGERELMRKLVAEIGEYIGLLRGAAKAELYGVLVAGQKSLDIIPKDIKE